MQEVMTVGKVRDAHGLSGEVFLIFFSGDSSWFQKMKTLTLKGQAPSKEGKHELQTVEYKIKSFRHHKNGILVKFEGVLDRTAAEKLIGYTIELPKETLTSQKGENIFLNEIEGFEVVHVGVKIGKIVSFSSNGAQDLLQIETLTSGIKDVPLVPDFVEGIDWKARTIRLKLPEGLLEDSE